MKLNLYILSILIILFQTGNVLCDTAIFNVNNIELSKDYTTNKDKLTNEAFKKGLKEDFEKVKNTSLQQIKDLISHYQVIKQKKENDSKTLINIFFNKNNIHSFFYSQNILYSDIINTEVIFFPLLIENKQQYIYSKNFFIENWNNDISRDLIQYSLPLESIENIRAIEKYKNDIYQLEILEFFREYDVENKVFVVIEKNKNGNKAKIFLNTIISGKRLIKTLLINKPEQEKEDFNLLIVKEIKKVVEDLIKSQNLIDVRTPSFLNVKIQLENKNNLANFDNRIKNIDLINNFYVQQLNKDYVLVKISYYGKITKIIKKLTDQKMDLKKINGEWFLRII